MLIMHAVVRSRKRGLRQRPAPDENPNDPYDELDVPNVVILPLDRGAGAESSES